MVKEDEMDRACSINVKMINANSLLVSEQKKKKGRDHLENHGIEVKKKR
jgi:hypothetical protein